MERGLLAFVEGRLERKTWWPPALPGGDLTVRKLAALEALSRSGRVQARLLGSLQILPNQWPTSALLDWMQLLGRVPDLPARDSRLAEAEQILRARLNLQGTRMGFSTERDDDWWWLMVNGDVNSLRLILGAVDKPGWKADLPRLVSGALQRQLAGHWSTTVANAWGSLAIAAFAQRFERESVSGRTRAAFEPGAATGFDWQKQPAGGTLALGWPATPGATLRLSQDGSGKPWVTVASRAAVPVLKPLVSGYRISKTLSPVDPAVKPPYARGDVLRVHLDIDVQADSTWVVVDDPVPGGASILGSGLGRDSAIDSASEQVDNHGWLAYQERRLDAFRAYYRYLPKGRFSIEYTVRLNNPGTFQLPQTRVEAMYAPEMFGESPNAAVVVRP